MPLQLKYLNFIIANLALAQKACPQLVYTNTENLPDINSVITEDYPLIESYTFADDSGKEQKRIKVYIFYTLLFIADCAIAEIALKNNLADIRKYVALGSKGSALVNASTSYTDEELENIAEIFCEVMDTISDCYDWDYVFEDIQLFSAATFMSLDKAIEIMYTETSLEAPEHIVYEILNHYNDMLNSKTSDSIVQSVPLKTIFFEYADYVTKLVKEVTRDKHITPIVNSFECLHDEE